MSKQKLEGKLGIILGEYELMMRTEEPRVSITIAKIISIIEPLIEEAHNISHAVGFRDGVVAEQKRLYGKLKEAKREEGERMINWLNEYCDRHEQPYNGHCYEGKRIAKRKDCYECWQALVKK